ncbi:MAG TPA: bifunctional oligoribonuclease/PAP phosphatase NrnA [Eubacteriales bacterium]|nr:bifunctional oligoribonuclease/PAP phosphatase NrnA [Eubacteriales bacterium]
MLAEAVRFFGAHDDLLLIAHVSPDGDTLGSCFALYGALTSLGKRVQIVCEDPVPAVYRFLPFSNRVIAPEAAKPAKAAVSVDCADLARTGRAEALFAAAEDTLNIDHHGTNDRYAANNFVQKAGATGELVYGVITALGVPVDQDAASCLYAAVTTDTGNFSYSNTTPDTLRIAAELLETGIDLPEINRKLFRTVPYHKLMLQALAVTKARLYEDGRIGVTALTLAEVESCGASAEDTEGIIDSIRDIDTVEIAAMLREAGDGKIRVSLRGKTCADVSRIATAFGGGGHRLAAGCTMEPPIEEAAEQIMQRAVKLLHGDCE